MTVADDAGVSVVVERKPERIISLTSFTDEILLDLVSLERLIGVTVFSQDPDVSNVVDKAAPVPHKLQLNVEVILSLRPDLVFVANWTDASEVAQMRGSSWDEIVRRASLVNAVGGFDADDWGQVTLSRETMLLLDPDLLILPGWAYGKPVGARSFYGSVVNDPALRSLGAIREGRVYRMPEGLRAAASQYIVDAVEYLSRLAYRELWEK